MCVAIELCLVEIRSVKNDLRLARESVVRPPLAAWRAGAAATGQNNAPLENAGKSTERPQMASLRTLSLDSHESGKKLASGR